MPNDCTNMMTIAADTAELNELIQNEFMVSGTDKFNDRVTVVRRGPGAIELKLWSAWHPDFDWFAGLLAKYPSCWVKNEWYEVGGNAGVWIGYTYEGTPTIKRLEWGDMCLEEFAHRFGNV